MNKATSIALLVVGILLLGYGINAYHSVGSGFSVLFTGAPTDKTIWLLVLGSVAAIVGFLGLYRGPKN